MYLQDEQKQKLTVGTAAWFSWLETASTFSFVSEEGRFTARQEQASQQRGGRYWKAYCKQHGKLSSRYLGKSETLTLERLRAVAVSLTNTPCTTAQHGYEAPPVSSPLLTDDLLNPLLATKLHPPRLRTPLVSRSHLVQRLQQGVAGPLTLLSAPPGYGKTTLLTQWQAESTTRVAWLSLEQQDNDPVCFLTYLLAALQKHCPDLDMNILALLQAPQHPPLQKVLAVLSNDLMNRQRGDLALVFDDYQVIEASPIHHALAFLLDHLPSHIHLILSTRADPPLPLARLRARGQLTELRAADLRLSSCEAGAFLQIVMGLNLPLQAVLSLQRRTEGWVAALQLAALSLRGREDVSTFLVTFTGSHRFVFDYLSEEVLSRLPAPVLSFLQHTCILERLCGSLCDAVTEQEDSQAMLENLEHANLFVVPLDDERRWYRYHHLFAELLQNRLQRTQPALVAQLHQRASLWYEHHHLPIEAVQHALAAHDVGHAARLIADCAPIVLTQGRTRMLLDWLNALPEPLVRSDPWLCIYSASALHLLDQLEETETWILDAEWTLSAKSPIEQAIIKGLATAIRANLVRFSGNLEQALALAQKALDLLPEIPETLRATVAGMLAHTYLVSGDVTPNTEQQVTSAVEAAQTSGYRLVHFRALTLLARLQMLQGRLRKASATYEQAGQATPGEVLQVLSASAVYCFALGDLLLEWNRLNEAEQLIVQGMEQLSGKRSVYGDDVLFGYLTLVRLQQARGEYSRALATLDAFTHLTETRHFPLHMRAIGDTLRAQIALAQGKLTAAVCWADASGLSCLDAEISYPREQEYLTLARVRLAQGREDPAGPWLQQVQGLLERLLRKAQANARMRSVLEILVMQALTLDAQGKRDEALSTLHEVLKRAEPEGYIRLFVDTGPCMQLLLQQIQARGLLSGYVASLLSAFEDSYVTETVPAGAANEALVEPLTGREREVLHLLSVGASNREIACRLVLSLGTVKKHMTNLLGKLGATNRTQAIVRAREYNLL